MHYPKVSINMYLTMMGKLVIFLLPGMDFLLEGEGLVGGKQVEYIC